MISPKKYFYTRDKINRAVLIHTNILTEKILQTVILILIRNVILTGRIDKQIN